MLPWLHFGLGVGMVALGLLLPRVAANQASGSFGTSPSLGRH
ncbi:hypothetical protein [Nocardia brasiliensis]|nr:hypothetical protein [Nocardia brasiliensis]